MSADPTRESAANERIGGLARINVSHHYCLTYGPWSGTWFVWFRDAANGFWWEIATADTQEQAMLRIDWHEGIDP